ncbi:MAG TPA: hypothetical protein VNH18_11085 [Bryobacteraceae bacterium]|nr:hypothetical protein [Bryobacteraceae bacterium]
MPTITHGKVPDETLIYALAKGETGRFAETLMYDGGQLLTQAQVDQIIAAADAAGWHDFRVVTVKAGEPPEFGRNVLA